MKRLNKLVLVISSVIVFFALTTISVNAQDKLEGTSFSKKVKHPDNQITDGEALNLMMKPGQKQKVNVELKNYSDKEITVEAKVSGARTNGSGGIEYSPSKFKKDKSMKYDLPDLVKVPAETKVPAKGTVDLVLDISMPETAYDGIVLGGVELSEKGQKFETKDEKGATIENKIAFLFGVTLRMNDNKVKPDFKLRSVKAGLQNYRNSIIVSLGNTQNLAAKDLVLNAEITKKGKTEVLYQRKANDVTMAPNSIMEYAVSLDGDRMVAGDYTAHIVLKGYDREWKWDEDFKITQEDADRFNKQDPYLVQERGLDWKMIAMIVGGVLAVVIIIVVILKVTKKKPSSKKESSSKKKSSKRK